MAENTERPHTSARKNITIYEFSIPSCAVSASGSIKPMTTRHTTIGKRKRSFFRCLSFMKRKLFSWRQDTDKLCLERNLFSREDFYKYRSSDFEISCLFSRRKYFRRRIIKNLFVSFFSIIDDETSRNHRDDRSDIVSVRKFEK